MVLLKPYGCGWYLQQTYMIQGYSCIMHLNHSCSAFQRLIFRCTHCDQHKKSRCHLKCILEDKHSGNRQVYSCTFQVAGKDPTYGYLSFYKFWSDSIWVYIITFGNSLCFFWLFTTRLFGTQEYLLLNAFVYIKTSMAELAESSRANAFIASRNI